MKHAGDGKTVFELLESKHPDQREANPEIFQEVHELPMLINVDITSSHVVNKPQEHYVVVLVQMVLMEIYRNL